MTWSSDFPKAAISRTIIVSIKNLAKKGEERIGLKLKKIGPTFERAIDVSAALFRAQKNLDPTQLALWASSSHMLLA